MNFVTYDQESGPVLDTARRIVICPCRGTVYAVRLGTWEVLWGRRGSAYPGCSPAFYQGDVYTIDGGRLVVCDGLTGEDKWYFDGDLHLAYDPVISDGYVFVTSDDNVYAVNIATHQQEWTYPFGGYLTPANDGLYVSSADGILVFVGGTPTPVDEPGVMNIPESPGLAQNYPNPFNASTTISYEIARRSFVALSIYNILGREVAILVNCTQSAGTHQVSWDGMDINGKPVASGAYFYKLRTADLTQTKKMVLLK